MRKLSLLAVLALALPWATSCYVDEQLGAKPLPNTGELMRRYISIGNSLTAGLQSGGINDSLQNEAYPVLFARSAGTSFAVPSLEMPGCPGPLNNNVLLTRVGGGTSTDCELRTHQPLPPFFNNLAVPGAHAIDPLDNLDVESNANALTMFILGGKTQVQAMTDAAPTFVSAWIGANDVLGALTSSTNPGDPSQITSQADFETRIRSLYDAIDATGAGAAVISVPDVTLIPFASAAFIYWCGSVSAGGACGPPQFPPSFAVDPSCALGAPEANALVPWTIGVGLITAGGTLDCTNDAMVASTSEVAGMVAAVNGYNTFLAAEAGARGYGYFDINPSLLDAVVSGDIPAFPDISGAPMGQSITFGPLFSLDGVHPSTETHRLVADSIISTVNRTFNTTIPFVQ
jgi:lysophospholipase L1-like esterase